MNGAWPGAGNEFPAAPAVLAAGTGTALVGAVAGAPGPDSAGCGVIDSVSRSHGEAGAPGAKPTTQDPTIAAAMIADARVAVRCVPVMGLLYRGRDAHRDSAHDHPLKRVVRASGSR